MKRVLFVAALCASAMYFGLVRIATFANAGDPVIMVDELQTEEALYAPPTPEVVQSLTGKLELLCFTYQRRGVCGACDLARGTIDDLCDVYPITRVYYDSARGYEIAREYGVGALPTFVLVRRGKDGKGREIERFSGAYPPAQMEAHIDRMFRRAGWDQDSDDQPVGARPVPKLAKAPARRPLPQRFVWIGW